MPMTTCDGRKPAISSASWRATEQLSTTAEMSATVPDCMWDRPWRFRPTPLTLPLPVVVDLEDERLRELGPDVERRAGGEGVLVLVAAPEPAQDGHRVTRPGRPRLPVTRQIPSQAEEDRRGDEQHDAADDRQRVALVARARSRSRWRCSRRPTRSPARRAGRGRSCRRARAAPTSTYQTPTIAPAPSVARQQLLVGPSRATSSAPGAAAAASMPTMPIAATATAIDAGARPARSGPTPSGDRDRRQHQDDRWRCRSACPTARPGEEQPEEHRPDDRRHRGDAAPTSRRAPIVIRPRPARLAERPPRSRRSPRRRPRAACPGPGPSRAGRRPCRRSPASRPGPGRRPRCPRATRSRRDGHEELRLVGVEGERDDVAPERARRRPWRSRFSRPSSSNGGRERDEPDTPASDLDGPCRRSRRPSGCRRRPPPALSRRFASRSSSWRAAIRSGTARRSGAPSGSGGRSRTSDAGPQERRRRRRRSGPRSGASRSRCSGPTVMTKLPIWPRGAAMGAAAQLEAVVLDPDRADGLAVLLVEEGVRAGIDGVLHAHERDGDGPVLADDAADLVLDRPPLVVGQRPVERDSRSGGSRASRASRPGCARSPTTFRSARWSRCVPVWLRIVWPRRSASTSAIDASRRPRARPRSVPRWTNRPRRPASGCPRPRRARCRPAPRSTPRSPTWPPPSA